MAKKTPISYAHHTFSPWWGCSKVSEGCEHCYAEQVARRRGLAWGPNAPRQMMAESTWKQPLAWSRAAERAGVRRRVLTSMCDVFERPLGSRGSPVDEARLRFFRLIRQTPQLDWLVLTKRPENMAQWHSSPTGSAPGNLWLGVTVEMQRHIDRIAELLKVPAAVHFVSAEPLLGPLDIEELLACRKDCHHDSRCRICTEHNGVRWLIAGCESGSGRRPCNPDWLRSLRDQCRAAGVPFWLKQMEQGGRVVVDPELDGRRWTEVPTHD